MTAQHRSWLFVPGDSARKIEKSATSAADIIIYDLEDAVLEQRRSEARRLVVAALHDRAVATDRNCVRINPIQTLDASDDLAAIAAHPPAWIMLPKVRHLDDIDTLAEKLNAIESGHALPGNSIRIIALMTETPSMTLALSSVHRLHPRVAAVTWGGEDLATALGANANRDTSGRWLPTFEWARSQCLLLARTFGVSAIDTLHADFRDEAGMRDHAQVAARDGFDGVLAIHPDQIAPIHAAFTPSAEAIMAAQAIVNAFAKNPEVGSVQLNGKMLDRPHLDQAKRLLERGRRER